jgi:hypothetical protein
MSAIEGASQPGEATAARPRKRFTALRHTIGNILAGGRMLLFIGSKNVAITGAQVPMLVLSGMLTLFILSFVSAGPYRYFNPYGIAVALSAYLVIGLACYLAAAIHGRRRRSITLFVIITSMGPAAILAVHLIDLWYGEPVIFAWLIDSANAIFVVTWAAIYAFAAVYSAMEHPRPFSERRLRAISSSSILAVSIWGYLAVVPTESIWESWSPSSPQEQESRLNVERIFYRQPELVAESLRGLAPGRNGVVDIYFVGFAGYAREQVFLNEVSAAADLLASRFNAAERVVRLANSRKTAETLPIASATNLRMTLAGVARKMNVSEDVLFLFLSSHGGPRQLGIEFWPLQLNQLSAAELKEMLDASGIKWRVLVISACYSGSFIDVLKDENTMIMTASAADKTSFGCGHDGPFTYFGEAFFGQALREELSFSDAFRNAKARIEQRERTEGLTPSEPQIHEGAKISERLRTIELRLAQMERIRALRAASTNGDD